MSEPTRDNSVAEVDLTGRTLGDFHLLRRLGRGGMAEVWLAEQSTLRRQVAVKVLKSQLSSDDTYIKRFQFEARAAAQLTHANIVQIYDVGCDEGVYYIAQEYVQGQNLREYMVRQGPPDLKLALVIIRQVAAALHKAGESGIVHRDIKPDNIMLSSSGEVKVADFGLARISGDEGLNLTRVGMTMGTPLYMSPEQVEGRPIDARSDIYSFGVTCYHMLAGTPPFRGETALSVAVQHLKTRPEPLESARPDLPSGLCRIVHKMLAKDPAQRYATPREILRDLRALNIDGLDDDWEDVLSGVEPLSLSPSTSATERLGHLMKTESLAVQRRTPWKWMALVVVAAFAVGAGMAMLSQPTRLLADADSNKTSIGKQQTVQEQYFLAAQLDTEEGWRSVLEHFPEKEYYVRRAMQQLARWHLRHGNYDESLKLFETLANLPDTENDFRAFGLAGKCIILMFQGKHDEATAALVELNPIRQELDDESLRQVLVDVLETNHERLEGEAATAFEHLLSEPSPQQNGT